MTFFASANFAMSVVIGLDVGVLPQGRSCRLTENRFNEY